MADLLYRMRQLRGTTAEWAANDLIIGDGEIALERVVAGDYRMKVGDGVRAYSALPYTITGSAADVLALLANDASAAEGPALVAYNPALVYPPGSVGGALNAEAAAVQPIARGGTGASTAGQALTNLGLIDVNQPVVLSDHTLMTAANLGRLNILIDKAVPENLAITLPSAAPTGALLLIKVDPSVTKLMVVKGGGPQLDGASERIMWRGETALLLKTSGGWTKLDGISRAFNGGLTRSASQAAVPINVFQQVAFTDKFGDTVSNNLCLSVSSNFSAPRDGVFVFDGNLTIAGLGAAANLIVGLIHNSGTPTVNPTSIINDIVAAGATQYTGHVGAQFNLKFGDAVGLVGLLTAAAGGGASFLFDAALGIAPTLSFREVPQW